MICVLCATIIFAVCHLSSSLENQQTSFYANPSHDPENPQSSYTKTVGNPQPSKVKKQSNIDSNQDTPRRNRHYPTHYSDDVPKYREKMWRFDLDVPEVLDTIKKYTGVSITDANNPGSLRAKEDGFLGQKLRFEVKPPNIAYVMGFLSDLINVQSARRFNRVYQGYVEEGPGTIKSLSFDYPPGYQEGRLKTLMRIKKKREAKG